MFGFGKGGRRRSERENPSDRRGAGRGRVLLSGKIVYGGGFTADCAIRDISDTGACVLMHGRQPTPPEMYLIVVRDGVVHRARTLWTRHPLAGLTFVSSHDFHKTTPPHLQQLRNLWAALTPA
jgi:hypothetical protein